MFRVARGSRWFAAAVVAVVSLGLAGSAFAASGRYRGKSAQGLSVRVGAKRSFGRTFTYHAKMTCSDGTTFTDGTFFDDVRIKRGRFKDNYSSDKGAVKNNVKGRLRGRRASGTLRVIERFSATLNSSGFFPLDPKGTVTCDSGIVKWKAHA